MSLATSLLSGAGEGEVVSKEVDKEERGAPLSWRSLSDSESDNATSDARRYG